MNEPLIEVKNLKKYFPVGGGLLHAVDDVSLRVDKGETMGVVGESGCGKSTLGRTIIRLLEPTSGEIWLNGQSISKAKGRQLREARNHMQIVFQDPYSSLNPRQRISSTVLEPLIRSGRYPRKAAKEEAARLMDLVGVDTRLRMAYPHELDGGRRQRVGIARALALNPEFVVCDEPVSALDVSIQAQVLNLLIDLRDQTGVSYLFVTHDLSVVRHISDRICVMYLGQIVELSPAKELFEHTLHPYTRALLSAIPSLDITHPSQRIPLKGEIVSPVNPKPGSRFAPRSPYATPACQEPQTLREVSPGHQVACNRLEEIS
ncbi:MAG: ATP-binding cassette domain-containing protein [Propionibacteriaceae bacterium]|jgi:peptide/nickel transport system ATP-binding protein|nr:ATP-binding cassette domain-containing protein [Propionibacteriaceae bacterium]